MIKIFTNDNNKVQLFQINCTDNKYYYTVKQCIVEIINKQKIPDMYSIEKETFYNPFFYTQTTKNTQVEVSKEFYNFSIDIYNLLQKYIPKHQIYLHFLLTIKNNKILGYYENINNKNFNNFNIIKDLIVI
jgi:hypothetical protein